MNQGYANSGFNGRGMDDDDNKKTKKKKVTNVASNNKGGMVSGQGIGGGKDSEMFKNQFKVKGVGKGGLEAPSTSSKPSRTVMGDDGKKKKAAAASKKTKN